MCLPPASILFPGALCFSSYLFAKYQAFRERPVLKIFIYKELSEHPQCVTKRPKETRLGYLCALH